MIHIDSAISLLKEKDPSLENYLGDVKMHLNRYNAVHSELVGSKKLSDFANGHMYFGFHKTKSSWVFREWLPGADRVWLYGDFNLWDKTSHPLKNIGDD